MTMPSSEIDAAARLLEQGRLVAFPTETVYGLGADAENPAALARIFAAKGRPADHPLIVHLAPGADLGYWVGSVPAVAQQLIAAFWPGPLTLILPRAAHIPAAVAGGQSSIGIRCPSHPVAQALLRAFKGGQGGIAAPSANRFGQVSPTIAQHVRDEFGTEIGSVIDMVVDGGQSAVGIESTIVDLSRLESLGPLLLRPGHIDAAQLAAVLGRSPGLPDAAAPRASGTLAAHYAPRTPLVMVSPTDLSETVRQLTAMKRTVALLHLQDGDFSGLQTVQLAARPQEYAHGLYAALRTLDAAGAALIVVEAVPDTAPWQAIGDRLRRAAYGSTGVLEGLLYK